MNITDRNQDEDANIVKITDQDRTSVQPNENDDYSNESPAFSVNSDSIEVLPSFTPAHDLNFTWGHLNGEEVECEIDKAYDEVVHWRRNIFKIPSGKQGKAFVQEMASLFLSYAEASTREK